MSYVNLPASTPLSVVLCDGGLGNRIPLLVTARVLHRQGIANRICWPTNMWCGASIQDLFEPFDQDVIAHNLLTLVSDHNFENYFMHERQVGSVNFKNPNSFFETGEAPNNFLLYSNTFPSWVTSNGIKEGLQSLRLKWDIVERAVSLISQLSIDRSVMGLHIRGTDLKSSSSIQAALQLVQGNIGQRFFLCTDDEEIRNQFVSYKNILINQSTTFVDKRWPGDWRSTGTDEIGRPTSFNVQRSKENIVDALIEALVLSRTTILNTSNSTFLRFARMLNSFNLERS
jgi:hypothetical protein